MAVARQVLVHFLPQVVVVQEPLVQMLILQQAVMAYPHIHLGVLQLQQVKT
jgi:hypothetical protein